jgi:hypothetical protein
VPWMEVRARRASEVAREKECQRLQDHAQDDTSGFLVQHQTRTHRREPSRIPVECSCPSTHMHVSISRLTGTFSHPSVSKISETPTASHAVHIHESDLKYFQLAASAIGADSTHEGARDKIIRRRRSPFFQTISTFPHKHVRGSRQESAARSLLEDPWSPCGTARDKEGDFRGGTTRVYR